MSDCRYCKKCVEKHSALGYNSATENTGGATMEDKEIATIPYFAHESEMARMERQIKRLWIVLIMTIVFLVATNAAWIWYNSQFEVTETTVTQDVDSGDGDAYVAGIGDVYDGSNPSNSEDAQANP